ncbi:MAG TPA: ABC transporter permease subunit [Candidatus Limnocylindrales bacterium]|jgi:putative spermidine/putrescine transport system permease protein
MGRPNPAITGTAIEGELGPGPHGPGAAPSNSARRSRRSRYAGRIFWWLIFLIGFLYFFLPLYGTLDFSLKSKPFGSAYTAILSDSGFVSSLGYSFVAGILTIIISILIIVPTAFWVRLKYPQLRPFIEFITLLPFVIPPVILVYGLLNTYNGKSLLPLGDSDTGLNVLLVAAYVVLSFPYMYRAVDTGLRAIDIQSLTEASQSLGAGWGRILWQVILPNLRTSLLSGAFLSLAIVVGEFTIATFMSRPAFAPYLNIVGDSKPYEQAALALVSFGITWLAMILIAVIGRNSRSQIKVTVG